MQLLETEQQILLEQTLERFIQEFYSLQQRKLIVGSADGFSREHWAFFCEMGLLGLPFKEDSGGLGGSLADVAAVMRMLGKGLVVEPYVQCVLMAGKLLNQSTSAAPRDRWLPSLINGEALFGIAHTERHIRFGKGDIRSSVIRKGDGWSLSGRKMLVPIAHALDIFLVSAFDDDDVLRICVVPARSRGIDFRCYHTVDGHTFGDVDFDRVELSSDAILEFDDVKHALATTFTYANAALCSEAVGCMHALFDMTLEYAKIRKQFGRAIGNFQVIKHRLVDCYTYCEQARNMALLTMHDENPSWPVNIAAAKAFICERAIAVGHESIQIHGGMGLTDELAVSHYHKRIVAITTLLGDISHQHTDFIEKSDFIHVGAHSTALDFERLLSDDERDFRRIVLDFLRESLTPEIRQAVRRQTCSYPEKDIAIKWHNSLNSRGWLAAHWPKKYRGTGWTSVEHFLYEYEAAVAGAPELVPMGFRYVGPVIARFGTEEQRSFFLPKMLSGEHYWAQGFSEPEAGSDLAALRTTAIRDGDSYIVNGSKMWTTHAHYANWLFCIVRTSKSDKPQDGISFLLIDMSSPGVKVKPIALLTSDHEVNQVFLDNVRVPITNRIGEEGRGWEYTKFLLEFERGGAVFCGRMRAEFNLVKDLLSKIGLELQRDSLLARKLTALEHRLMALEITEFKNAKSESSGNSPGIAGSMTKLLGSELQKDITEIGIQIAGYAGLEFEMTKPSHGKQAPSLNSIDLELTVMARYLNMRVSSIYGGSSEIQREILGKHILALK